MEPLGDELSAGVVTRAEPIPGVPPRAVLEAAEAPRTAWSAPGELGVVGSGAAAVLTAGGADRFDAVREAAASLFASGNVHAGTEAARPRLFGGFAFHDDHDGGDPWTNFPGAQFVLPRVQVTDTGEETWLTVNAVGPDASPGAVERRLATVREELSDLADPGPVGTPPGVVDRRRTTERDDWRDSVTTTTDRIRAGELRKVVLAQALRVDLARPVAPPDILARLARTYPECFRFLVEPASGEPRPTFLGATPERLVHLRGRTVSTGALAGTTGRGETPAEDEWLAGALLADEKNAHEHELVVEAIRDQLAPFARTVSTGERGVRRLATVQHLETPVTAELAADEHVLSLVEALHPTPAVGGLPPAAALATIRETEPFDRGWYAAPVGWFDAGGYGSFAVALRSAIASGDTATLFAGVGIVGDSDPDAEWDEVQLKYRPILDELE